MNHDHGTLQTGNLLHAVFYFSRLYPVAVYLDLIVCPPLIFYAVLPDIPSPVAGFV